MNSNMPTRTGWFLIVLALVALIYEIYVLIFMPEEKTISEVIWTVNDRTIVLSYIAGFLSAHFFWARRH